jgi:hypothetical protein
VVRAAAIAALLFAIQATAVAQPTPKLGYYRLRIATVSEIKKAGLDIDYFRPGSIRVTGHFGYRDPINYSAGQRIPFGDCVGVTNLSWWQHATTADALHYVMALDPPPCARAKKAKTVIIWAQRVQEVGGPVTVNKLQPFYCFEGGTAHDWKPFCCFDGQGCDGNWGFGNGTNICTKEWNETSCIVDGCDIDYCEECTSCLDFYAEGETPQPDAVPDENGGCEGPECFPEDGDEDPEIPEVNDCADEGVDPLFCCEETSGDSDADGICNACDAPSAGCDDEDDNGACDDCEEEPEEDTSGGGYLMPAECKPSQNTWCCESSGMTDTDADGICNRCDADVQQPPGNSYCIDIDPRDGICDGCQGKCDVCGKLDQLIAAIKRSYEGDEEYLDDKELPTVQKFDAGYTQTPDHELEYGWATAPNFGEPDMEETFFTAFIPIPGDNGVHVNMLNLDISDTSSVLHNGLLVLRNCIRTALLAFFSYKWLFAFFALVKTL